MALEISSSSSSSPIKLKTFLGLHECPDGDTKLIFGEAPVMENLRITSRFGEKKSSGGNLQTRPGNKTLVGLLKGYTLNVSTEETLLIAETLNDDDTGITIYGYDSANVNSKGMIELSMSAGDKWQINWKWLKETTAQNIYFQYGYYDYKFSRYEEIPNGDGTSFLWYAKKITAVANTDNTNHKIQGMWSGILNGKDTFLAACNGKLWSLWDSTNNEITKVEIGDIDCTNNVSFFPFDGKVYMLNGKEYKEYNGKHLVNVEGYRPKIFIMDMDNQNATALEGVNKLTGARSIIYNTNGTTNTFKLPEQNIVTVDFVICSKDEKYLDDSYYDVDKINGTIKFKDKTEIFTYTSSREFIIADYDTSHIVIGKTLFCKLNDVALTDTPNCTLDDANYKCTFVDAQEPANVKCTYTEAKENFTGDGEKIEFELNNTGYTSSVIKVDEVVVGYDGSCYTYDDNDKLVIAGAPKKDAAISVQETYANAEETFSGTATATEYTLTNGKIDSISLTIDGEEYKQTEITFPIYPFMSTVVMENEATWIGKFARPSSIVANNYYFFYVLAENTWKYNGTSATYNASTATACDLLTDYGIRYTGTPNDMDCIQVKDDIRWYTTVASNFVTKFKVKAATGTNNIKVSETRSAVLTETFTGDGKTTTYTLTNKKADSLKVTIDNVEYPRQACTFDSENNKYVFIKAPKNGSEIIVTETFTNYDETFTGDKRTEYVSANTGITSLIWKLNNVRVISVPQYVFDIPNKKLTISDEVTLTANDTIKLSYETCPISGTESFEVGYTAINTFRDEVLSMRFFEMFNGEQDSRVFLYGNNTNEAIYSDVDYWQKARADYFPDLNEVAIGATNTPIMDMCRHNTLLIVNKSDEAYFIEQSTTTDAEGLLVTTFKTSPISKNIGSSVLGQMQMVENNPRFLFGKELYEWTSVNYYGTIRYDERQAKRISDRIYETLSTFDVKNTYCYDYNYGQEYYICNNGKVLINNYANNTWYIYTDLNINCMCEFMNELYFGTTDGKLQKFSESYYANDGEEIKSYWESGYMDFGYENMRKSASYVYVVLNPQSGGRMMITATTDRRTEFTDKTVNASVFDFENVDFDKFTFNTNHSAKTKRLKLKMKKFVFCKLILKSAGLDTRFTALSIAIDVRMTGKAK